MQDKTEPNKTKLDKNWSAAEAEQRLYALWEEAGVFKAPLRDADNAYCVVIPPPNVTGSLHVGHALNNTLQDIFIRWQRMQGRDVLWQPGSDHAGIATQMVVERQMAEEGLKRADLGREKFINRVWDWKAQSGGAITRQLRRLGASCDWSRERFTMDEGLSKAVRTVFVRLHKKGLIYRDKRLVNWDPKLHTAISDLEVNQREEVGKLWYFRYPVEGLDGTHITVATTRPETMLGDTGVAVHPDDMRYGELVGKCCILPITGRRIPIVADHHADPEKGTGAVKITPAHDFNDFEVGRRHDLELLNIFDENAHYNDAVPDEWQGMERYAARARIVEVMTGLGLLEKVHDNPMVVPYGDRSGMVVEPWLMDQWFLDVKALAGPAIHAVETGKTRIIPKQWENTYFEWMRNIQPWCISRQIWWGHQIPAWFGPDGTVFVEMCEQEALCAARAHYGRDDVVLERDPDVLDTWFSSALWPFSTLGWPEQTPALAHYYPTSMLVTGFDILFFWVARMMMMGLEFMGEVPFREVYIHALVRDEKGQKMSKSKGNVMDPLEIIDEYGADALRFTLCALETQGRDVSLSKERIEGYRNFCTKLWNAARFCEMNGCLTVGGMDAFAPQTLSAPANRWIVGKLKTAADDLAQAMAECRFNDVANVLFHFIRSTFCDWYLELAKSALQGEQETDLCRETQRTAMWVLVRVLQLAHPVIPFITEELYRRLYSTGADDVLATCAWQPLSPALVDAAVDEEIDWLIRLISGIRGLRMEVNVPVGAMTALHYCDASEKARAHLVRHKEALCRLARIDDLQAADAVVKGAVQLVFDGATFMLPLEGIIDIAAEQERLRGEIAKAQQELEKITKKLENTGFLEKAPPAVVDTERARATDAATHLEKIQGALQRLQDLA